MIIKKFVGKTEEEAIAAAKQELGDSIVVMNVRSVSRKGPFAVFQKKLIEVTVAKEEESERMQARNSSDAAIRETFRQVAQAAQVTGQNNTAAEMDEPAAAKQKKPLENKETAIEEKLENLQNMLFRQLQQTETETELVQMEKEDKKNPEMQRFVKLLQSTMLENEIEGKYADQIIEEVLNSSKHEVPFDVALGNVYQRMILKFGKALPITASPEGPKVIYFIGPTGVGKTTTIAKLASTFSLTEKKRIALLTADTYRIAAVEQLRTYASILEVPFQVIYSVEDMESAYQDFKNLDYILVDTAGHSINNEGQIENIGCFLHSLDDKADKETYLVLSATTKYRDLLRIADAYSKLTDYKIIFTKLDETRALGNLLNLKLYTGASLSYVTCGQNVPDDIEQFNPQKTVKLLLGGRN